MIKSIAVKMWRQTLTTTMPLRSPLLALPLVLAAAAAAATADASEMCLPVLSGTELLKQRGLSMKGKVRTLQFLLINWVAFGQCRGVCHSRHAAQTAHLLLTHMLPWHRLLLSPAGHRVSGSASRLRLRLRSVARSTYMRLLFRAVVVDHGNNTH